MSTEPTTVADVLPDETAEELKRLRDLVKSTREDYDEAIVRAYRANASTSEIGKAVGMSKVGVWKIIQRWEQS